MNEGRFTVAVIIATVMLTPMMLLPEGAMCNPPVIESFYPALDPQVNETDTIQFGVNVTDEDMNAGDRVNITWSIDGNVKKVDKNSWKSTYTLVTQYDGELSAGTYIVAASVMDSYDAETHVPVVQSWTLTVQNKNRPPQLIMVSPEADMLTVPENTAQDFSIEYLDPDEESVTVQWKADNRTMPGTRDKISVTYATDFNSSGVHELKAVLTDEGGAVTVQRWTVTVTNVDRPPKIVSSSPQGDSLQTQEGKSIMFIITVYDPDGTQPEVEWLIGAEPVEGATGTSYNFKALYEGAGSSEGSPYKVRAVIRDTEGMKDERSWDVAVDDVNRAPVVLIDEPQDESSFRLGTTIRFRADRSWDPDSADNSTLSYTWSFDDGSKTSALPVVNHKYGKQGNYTVRLTVRDSMTSTSALVSVTVVAPVLSIAELSFDPPVGASDGKRVNIQVRVANNGDALATNVRLGLTSDNILLTTLPIPEIEQGDYQDVHWAWTAEAGAHVIRASLEPAADTVIGQGGTSQKDITVKASAATASSAISLRTALIVSGGAGAAVLLLVGLAIYSRRKKSRAAPRAAAAAQHSPAATSQRVSYEQMVSAPAAPAPTQPLYPQFPGPAPPVPPIYPQFPGPAPPAPLPAAADPQQAGKAPTAPVAPPSGAPVAPAPSSQVTPAPPAPPHTAPAPYSSVAPSTTRAPPVAVTACPACGEPVESGWMVCPACSAPLPKEPPAPDSSPIASGIGELSQKLDGLAAAGRDVAYARGMLDIALSFLRSGNTEKAQQYLDKTRTVISELEG
jgi:PKD repeat protein